MVPDAAAPAMHHFSFHGVLLPPFCRDRTGAAVESETKCVGPSVLVRRHMVGRSSHPLAS
jgi:hypothetical protein